MRWQQAAATIPNPTGAQTRDTFVPKRFSQHWRRSLTKRNDLSPKALGASRSVLTVSGLGRFLCQGLFPERGRLHVGYAAVLLRVLVPVSKPFVRPTAAAVAEGATVALTCAVREGTEPRSFSWQHQQPRGGPSVSPERLGGTGAELHLTPANRSHTGWYICTVGNEVNNRTSEPVYLDIVYGPDQPAISVEPFSPEAGSFSAGEREDVVLTCLAPSNPPSRYVWLHNGSQVHTGPTYVLAAIARAQAGTYTCLAENPHLQTRTQATIVLTVYYPPAGSPSCSAVATGDLRDVALQCRWPGGFPPVQLRWVGPQEEEEEEGVMGASFSVTTSIQPGATTRNGSSFSCLASHPALPQGAVCGTTLWVPAGGPSCVAAATKGDEYVMLRCRWAGGTPPVTLRWWDSGGRPLGDPAPFAAILVLSANGTLGGRDFICAANHPLQAAGTECRLRLEVPKLEAERSEVAVLEGGEARLACRRHSHGANLGATVVWYDPEDREVTPGLAKYRLERGEEWVNLSVRDAEWPRDNGIYRCTAANAVGTTSLPVHLRVDRYPAPPNVTISKLRYTRARTEVRLEWRTQGSGNLTGFVVQRRQAKKPSRRVPGPWETAAGDIEPHSRDRRLGGLDPAVIYAFRVLAVNHRTAGHPSEVQTPAEPPFEAYPAVTAAAVVGMLVATAASLLAVHCIARHRDTLPRLHDLLFRMAAPGAQEPIGTPEDAETTGEEGAAPGEAAAPGPAAEPLSAPPDTTEERPVTVTVTTPVTP
ncbi:V-set and immunoglobulin domain-containing protein 10-like 2 [Athene cunicularia]|uniref:V-set and immunoglobulin domain-containing protein 10-like 2 n=1 Tax=Athene cunicularia TaxID=194338 RepID=UPI000EF71DD2|nr:V-set and immunoglobulin domain-containing protein 10-like 2 [Athene cunicularia]